VRLSDLSCASITKEQVKWGLCGVSQAKRLRLLKDLGQCLQICLLDLQGTWLDGKGKIRGQTDCTNFRIERVGGKAKVERTVGLFQTILLASALRAGASWVLFSGPGRLSYSFSHFYPTSHTYDWSPFVNQSHSSA
jgi:hypothetical protein